MTRARDLADQADGIIVGDLNVDGGTIKLDGNYPVGTNNVALGNAALDSNVSGASNTAIGADALTANTAGNNTAVGYQAGYSNTTGATNVAVGNVSLRSNTTGSALVAVGHDSLNSNSTGNYNTSVGTSALAYNTTASNNTGLGYRAGYLSTGSYNTFVGNDSGYSMTTGTKNTIIGRYDGNTGGLDIRTSSNNIVLSDGDGNPRVWINNSGYIHSLPTYNNTTGSGANLHVESSGQFVRSTSSLRYKNTVNDATHGLTELLALRPVTYKGNNDGDTIFGGLIAEEVHDAGLTEFVQYNDDGEPDALAYGNMVSLCIKAIQELSAKNDALTARITALEGN
jgi:trimeric autotransporter adhesin